MAKSKRARRFTGEERTAYHEAGHAVLRHYLEYAGTNSRVTIKPNADSRGHVLVYPEKSFRPDLKYDLRKIVDRITVCLAGNAAIKKLTGRWDNIGAEDDYHQAAGFALYVTGDGGDEVNALVRWLQIRAAGVVNNQWPYIEAVAAALLERKTLNGKEVREVIFAEEERKFQEFKQRNTRRKN